MHYRVRAAAIIFSKDQQTLLLIKHVHPETGETWWVPPGGAVEKGDQDIFHTAERETFEESNYIIKTSKEIRYIREFYEISKELLHLELFVRGEVISGDLSIKNIVGKGEDEHYIQEAAWLTQKEVQSIVVYPEIIKADSFWEQSDPNGTYLERQSREVLL
ncbi:MAG TPA: NUDIX hydrolase [Thermotogota bacterium]|nr:NUDIX hydrolase [Thermotogota bacterium]